MWDFAQKPSWPVLASGLLLLWGSPGPASEKRLPDCPSRLRVAGLVGAPAELARSVQATTQTPLDRLPEPVRDEVRKILKAAAESGWAYATVVLGVGDVFLVGKPGGIVTSRDDSRVSTLDILPVVLSLARQAAALPTSSRHRPVTLYHFHTHPHKEPAEHSLVRRPIYRDEKGNAYTLVTVPEDYLAQDLILGSLAVLLRQSGYTGPIRTFAGPLPARVPENTNPYIAACQMESELTAESMTRFRRFAIPPKTARVTLQAGSDRFELVAGDSPRITYPLRSGERLAVLFRRETGWTLVPNGLSETLVRVDGREVPCTGTALGPDSIVTIGGFSFFLD